MTLKWQRRHELWRTLILCVLFKHQDGTVADVGGRVSHIICQELGIDDSDGIPNALNETLQLLEREGAVRREIAGRRLKLLVLTREFTSTERAEIIKQRRSALEEISNSARAASAPAEKKQSMVAASGNVHADNSTVERHFLAISKALSALRKAARSADSSVIDGKIHYALNSPELFEEAGLNTYEIKSTRHYLRELSLAAPHSTVSGRSEMTWWFISSGEVTRDAVQQQIQKEHAKQVRAVGPSTENAPAETGSKRRRQPRVLPAGTAPGKSSSRRAKKPTATPAPEAPAAAEPSSEAPVEVFAPEAPAPQVTDPAAPGTDITPTSTVGAPENTADAVEDEVFTGSPETVSADVLAASADMIARATSAPAPEPVDIPGLSDVADIAENPGLDTPETPKDVSEDRLVRILEGYRQKIRSLTESGREKDETISQLQARIAELEEQVGKLQPQARAAQKLSSILDEYEQGLSDDNE